MQYFNNSMVYLGYALVLSFLPPVRVSLCLSQFSQLSVHSKKSSFVLRLEGVHPDLQLLFALLQLLVLLTELLFGTCR